MEDIEKYTRFPLPVKGDLQPDMDQFSFVPRITFRQYDSVKVRKYFQKTGKIFQLRLKSIKQPEILIKSTKITNTRNREICEIASL